MNLSFKICTMKDLDSLVAISRSTFIEAFEKDNDPEDFWLYINKAFNKESIKTQLQNPNSKFYFAYLNDQIIGYFKLNIKTEQTEHVDELGLELERIYILSSRQNKGFGNEILRHIISLAKSGETKILWLGVWQMNEAAVRFYERHGFVKFGSHPYYIGKDKQIDWLMKLDVM